MMRAIDFARLAQSVYTDPPTIGDPDSASRMHVYEVQGEVVHVFRGTDDFASIVADADIETVEIDGLGKLHAGFYGALQRILDRCLALPVPSAVAGHSLGAAMAQIYAGVLSLKGHQVACYAFEPPRVSWDNTLQSVLFRGGPVYATRNGNDIVTQVPLGFNQAWPLLEIGVPSVPIDNIEDHFIDRVIAALPT